MKYNILSIADIHWGALYADTLNEELKLFIEFIEEFDDNYEHIDLIVICGDYFDSKLPLNSKHSINALNWMARLKSLSDKRHIKIAIIKGTSSHDNDQLDAFDSLVDDNFIIIRENSLVEILPGLRALFCPDENMATEDYKNNYVDNYIIDKDINIGFFHGNFDVILPTIALQETEIQANNIVYEYDYWSKFISGPLIAGHWHTYKEYERLTYIGSYSRWGFNEEEPKGFLYTSYDTESCEYSNVFLENIYAKHYVTYDIVTSMFTSIDYYNGLINHIKEILSNDDSIKIRIKINVVDEKQENDTFIQLIKDQFTNNKQIKIVIKNKVAEKLKKKHKKEREEFATNVSFIKDNSLSISEKIRLYIKDYLNEDISLDVVDRFINPIIKK